MEHLNTICKKAKLKLHALNRISKVLSLIIINANNTNNNTTNNNTNNKCLHKISFQLLPIGLDFLLQVDYA